MRAVLQQAPTPALRTEPVRDEEDPRVRRGRALSLVEGTFATVMLGVTETFAVPAAVFLGAPPLAIALLGSLPLFLGSLGQLAFLRLSDSGKPRRRPVITGVLAQAVLLVACAAAGYASRELAPWVFVLAFVAFGVSGNLVNHLWISWMRDLTPAPMRGRFFAARNRVLVMVQLTCALLLGVVAREYTSSSAPWSFFFTIFGIAGIARALSGAMLALQYEPPRAFDPPSGHVVSLRPEFLRFCIATALLQGATAVSGPFFNVWYLKELHFDYLSVSLCTVATLVGSMLFLPIWGRVADRIGSFRLLLVAAALVAIVPLPYLVFETPRAIWGLSLYSGIVWSAYNLGHFNTLIDSVGNRHAEREIAIAVAITGIAVFAGGLLGGVLATHVPPVAGSRLRAVFLASAIGRLLVVLFLFRTLKPMAPLPDASPLDAFNELPGYRFGMGILRGAFRAFRRQ